MSGVGLGYAFVLVTLITLVAIVICAGVLTWRILVIGLPYSSSFGSASILTLSFSVLRIGIFVLTARVVIRPFAVDSIGSILVRAVSCVAITSGVPIADLILAGGIGLR